MIRILIADDHAIVRAGLRQFIADQVDMEVTAEAASGSETVAAVRAAEMLGVSLKTLYNRLTAYQAEGARLASI